jgi:cellulose synthase/poly-beta-1,6-N-acetylglucosamine synthase-like glycosyltransferase
MTVIYYGVFLIYVLALTYITVYCLMQLNLLYHYKRYHSKNNASEIPRAENDENLPYVTIQLPIFNEMYVVERLIDNIVQFDYPKSKFEIHVLDDSTDETVEITRKKVEEYKAKGFNIEQICRTDRIGYKAGALKEATKKAKGEFIAIFDADFLPRPDFLRSTIPQFNDPKVGVVQTRWEHINQDYSILTRLQALQLNVHFTVEQQGRRAGNYFLQFNGTAGVWRKETIDDAGGWEADTLTEDLDLSIRAQLKGWEIVYLEKFGSPAELPAEMNGLKSQQFRWMKGGAETAKKMLPTVWKSHMTLGQKIHATSHLLGSSVFLFIFLVGVISVPLLFILSELQFGTDFLATFLIGMLAIIAVYYVANVQAELKKESYPKMLFKFLILFPVFLALSMGLSLHNSIAVLQGYRGKKSPFVRTPKFNIKGLADSFKKQNYLASRITWSTFMEGILTLYFVLAVAFGIYWEHYIFIIFHALLAIGYGVIFYLTVSHLRMK